MIEEHEPRRHVILTERDYSLLKVLYENVVTSFYQIKNYFFKGRSHATAMNRLRLLENAGFISRTRVPRIKAWKSNREVGVVFQLAPKGVKALQLQNSEWDFVDKIPNINPVSLDHDLLLNDIKPKMLGLIPGGLWLNGRYLGISESMKKIPDAIIKLPSFEKGIAIELELSAKSSARYRQILAEFRASRDIEKVFYITAGPQIDRKILSELEGFEVPLGFKSRSGIFNFIPLSEVKT